MPNWFDQINLVMVSGVANRYMVENPLAVFNIFPRVTTQKLSGYIALYDKAAWFKIGTLNDYKRTGATESIGDDYTIAKQLYNVEEFAFHKDITEDEAYEYDSPFSPVRDAVQFVINRINRITLQNLCDTYLASGKWTTESAWTANKVTAAANGVSTYDPVYYMQQEANKIWKVTGYKPNRLIVTPDIDQALKLNTFITNRLRYTVDKVVTNNFLASLFEVETYHVMDAINGTATDFLKTNCGLLCYTPNAASVMAPSAGYQMIHTRAGMQIEMRRIPMPMLNNALRIEGVIRMCPIQVAQDLAVYLSDLC